MRRIITDISSRATLNWIPDSNRFGLPKPPGWFLQQMWDMDSALVILPSRIGQRYVLARRRELSLRVPLLVKTSAKLLDDTRGSDGDMLAANNLVHVDTIGGYVRGTWSSHLLQALKERDMWDAGGADAYVDRLEAQEAAVAAQNDKTVLDNIDHRARDAWKSYQARTGARTRVAGQSRPPRAKIVQVGTL